MLKIRVMRVEDVEAVARMDALDHGNDPEEGYKEARQHTLDHLEIVSQHCYVVEDCKGGIIAAMVLHPRKEIFEVEDFHVKDIRRNKEGLTLLKKRLADYLEGVETEVLCCPYAMKRLMRET
jgi:hypothetical protein